ncbi:MAG: retropepsin-like aspartic protease [Actinomycetota bacterium]|nr:retropepsin-like aspartic protease [Actinomycetota bacterium]
MVRHQFDPKAPVIVLSPTLEGDSGVKKKVSMALDTGATYTMIPWEIAEVLGYEPALSRERIDMVTASGVEKVPLVVLKSVALLGKSGTDIKAIVHNLPQRSYVDGLLGLSFLKNLKICLDFKKGILELD